MTILKDSIVALVTPFLENYEVDELSYRNLVKFHIKNETKGIVVCGTTGEAATLNDEEKLFLLKIAIEEVKKHNSSITIIFNSGTNNTKVSIKLSQQAEIIGAHSLLVIVPYYNRPTQEGLLQHFTNIAKSTKLPICLYNVPSRTSAELEVSTVVQLSKLDNVMAIKDATFNLNRPLEIGSQVKADFVQLSGEDSTVLAYLAQGGSGCISVSANVIPKQMQSLFELWYEGKYSEALQIQREFYNLHNAMFVESNPAPAKYALSLMGLCKPYVRLPLVGLKDNSKAVIEKLLKQHGLI